MRRLAFVAVAMFGIAACAPIATSGNVTPEQVITSDHDGHPCDDCAQMSDALRCFNLAEGTWTGASRYELQTAIDNGELVDCYDPNVEKPDGSGNHYQPPVLDNGTRLG